MKYKILLSICIISIYSCKTDSNDPIQNLSACGSIKVSGTYKTLNLGSNGGCYYINSSGNKSYVDRSLCLCGSSSNPIASSGFQLDLFVSKPIYNVSYNEIYEQPNWITYTVTNRPKNVDRGSMDFHLENGIHTSDDADYSNNEYDKGHMAPAATFSDSYDNLYQTFSYVNCAMQIDALNRTEWAELEAEERNWSSTLGEINVKIQLLYDSNHIIKSTGVHIPTAFFKQLTFKDGTKKCFNFPNVAPNKNWDKYQIACP